MRQMVLAMALVLSGISASHAQFRMDMTYQQTRQATGHLAVADLPVGGVGLLDYPSLCEKGGKLFTYRFDLLSETPLEYSTTYRIKRLPNDAVRLDALEGPQAAPGGLRNALQTAILNAISRDL